MKHIKSMTVPEIGEVLKELNQPAFRAKQVYSWLHKGVRDYGEVTNLPKTLRDTLAEKYYKDLCIDEINWCRKNASTIINKANCLYNLCSNKSNYKGKSRCLNFQKLEQICQKYNSP